MRERMPCKHYLIGGDRRMKRKKKWYDYLWIASLTYLILGFFNILCAWLGLLCFFIPLAIAVIKGNKAYCNKYCGRGQLFSLIGGRFGLSRKKDIPGWMLTSTILGFLTMVLFKPRSWCVYCPMGTMTQLICKAKNITGQPR